jgi:hypothetical protein
MYVGFAHRFWQNPANTGRSNRGRVSQKSQTPGKVPAKRPATVN